MLGLFLKYKGYISGRQKNYYYFSL